MRRAERGSAFVVWRAYQGRVDSMQPYFEYEPVYLGRSFGSKLGRAAEYVLKTLSTLRLLSSRRPAVVWLQLPPTPLLYVGALYKAVAPRVIVIADCHNSLFKPPWARTPALRRLLNRAVDLAIVHNEYVLAESLALGLDPRRVLVLETRPAIPAASTTSPKTDLDYPRPWVLFPAGFDPDEPISAFLGAAARLPDVTFVVTGDTRRAHGDQLGVVPPNVVLAGWVASDAYKALVAAADLVLGLTLVEGIQLSVANEAVGYGKALVVSDTKLLRSLFPKGAVYVQPDADDIANGIRTALRRRLSLETEATELRAERIERWTKQATAVRRFVEIGAGG